MNERIRRATPATGKLALAAWSFKKYPPIKPGTPDPCLQLDDDSKVRALNENLRKLWRKVVNLMPFAILGLSLSMKPALAQTQPPPAASVPPAMESTTKVAFGVLRGRWVRVQGGYVITINSVDPDGRLDASYANPRPLPFHTAMATRDGNSLKLFFELRAAGYNGSTYTLSYDATNDQLTGIYDQVVVKQKFDVIFVRDKS